jgi:hypothetical protein
MKKLDKKKVAVIAFATVASVGIAGTALATTVNAQMADGDYSPIIEKLAEAFGVSEAEVKIVFDENRKERSEEHLQEAVNDGLISEDQMQLLIVKKEEHRAAMDELKSQELTQDEFRSSMEELRNEFSDWAEENDIDSHMMLQGKGNNGMGGGQGFGDRKGGRGMHNMN